jgi:hypothetical protein
MHAMTVALFAFLLAGAPSDPAAATIRSQASEPLQAANGKPPGAWIQLAAGGKLADRYLAGRAGGRYGIGGPEQRKKKRGKTAK